ncbi:hypothetical protein ACFYYR_20640 [Streptomyces sp. NPDC001922]|uniref:hypothetical protein n=1 Tax=Streptomyces sp. NPDC001922 TaxID=3364624 RepID=UPI0036B0E1DA
MRPRRLLLGGVLAAATALGSSGAAHPAGAGPVVVEPATAVAGSLVSVFDGGNCRGSGGLVTFRRGDAPARIPSLRLTPLRDRVGGATTVPLRTRPGTYTASLMCHHDDGRVTGPFTGSLRVAGEGAGPDRDSGNGNGRSRGDHGHRDPDRPRGATQAGAGGTAGNAWKAGAGAGLVTTALGGAVLLHRRRTRREQG